MQIDDAEAAAAVEAFCASQNFVVPLEPLVRVHLRAINADEAVLRAASTRDQKTFTCEVTTDFMMKSTHAPLEVKGLSSLSMRA